MSDDRRVDAPARSSATGLRDVILDQHNSHPEAGVVEWAAIVALVLGVAIGAVTLVSGLLWLTIPAVVLVVAGIVTAFATDIMNRTEDY
jgi:hypothetical protein